ncbi:MAG: ice-binding family protein [Burkholderiales bacterium]|nr:ice-binding family protein [Burkholderiales bacterium]
MSLGKASGFAVLSAAPGHGGAVTCTDTTINGDVGSSGVRASVVQTNCTINGAIVAPVSAQVVTDFNTAYGKYTDANFPCTGTLNTAYTGETVTLTPGVYCNTAGVTFTDSTLILQGDANAVWIFRIGTGGTGALTGTNFTVVMDGGGEPCNVTWWVAEAVTMTTSGFQGTILAGAAITMTGLAGSTTPFNGNALAKAAVTLTNVTVNGCNATGGGSPSQSKCNQGVGNGPEGCDPGNSNQGNPFRSNDELGGKPGDPGRKGGNKK